jgi:LysM repeat protein
MRFSSTNLDILRMSSGSTSGLSRAGSAAVSGGTINVGSSASDATSELNPVFNDSTDAAPGGVRGDLLMAGNKREWAKTLSLQRATPSGSHEDVARSKSRGALERSLRDLMTSQPRWIETIIKPNPDDDANPLINVQFTDEYDQLLSLLGKKDEKGELSNNGTHILRLTDQPQASESPQLRLIKASEIRDKSAQSLFAWHQNTASTASEELLVKPVYINHGAPTTSDNVIDIANLQNAGTNKVHTRFTIVGFSKNPDPMAGKNSSISAFATNNKTVGSIRIPKDLGSIPTLQQIAEKYGVTLEQLMQVNNISNANQDIGGLNLVVPADFSTVGSIQLTEAETPAAIAKRYGISVAWLLELNGLDDPERRLGVGADVYIPGLRALGSAALPAAKPFDANLEYADYGAYTNYSVTYHIEGSLVPLFTQTFFNTLR